MKRRCWHGLFASLAIVCISTQLYLRYHVIRGADLIADIQYKREDVTGSIDWDDKKGLLDIIPCGENSSIPNRVFFPARFMNQPQFNALRDDLHQNSALLKNNYIIFGNRSSKFSVYYHVHKSGGTTMEHLPTQVEKRHLNWETERRIGKEAFDRASVELLDDMRLQNGTLFTFLRDPVSRFLSAVGQVLSMPQRHFKLSPCHKNTASSQVLVQCILNKMINSRNSRDYIDPHFVPQLYELVSAVQQQKDIGIQVFSLSSLDYFQKLCSIGAPSRYRAGGTLPHFPSLSADEALTPELIRQICMVYRMDVIFMEALDGFVPTLCMPGS